MKKNFIVCILILISTFNLFAQDVDTLKNNEDDFFKEKGRKHWWKNWDDEWSMKEFKGNPFIEINYGLGNVYQKEMNYEFAKIGSAELKIGYSKKNNFYDEKIIKFSDRYLSINRNGYDLSSKDQNQNELLSTSWNISFSKRKGYGYKIGDFYLLPYNSTGFVWSILNMKKYPPLIWPAVYPPLEGQVKAEKDAHFLDRINEQLKFGELKENGINLNIASSVGLNFGYETSIIFPRHLFWKHIGSLIIESAGIGLIDKFIDEVADSSPMATPIVNFILKGAYNYAIYTLKKDKMNWPFKTESPLTYETFKFGLTFTF